MLVFECPRILASTSIGIPYSTAMQAKVWRAQWVVSTLSMPHTAAISFM